MKSFEKHWGFTLDTEKWGCVTYYIKAQKVLGYYIPVIPVVLPGLRIGIFIDIYQGNGTTWTSKNILLNKITKINFLKDVYICMYVPKYVLELFSYRDLSEPHESVFDGIVEHFL